MKRNLTLLFVLTLSVSSSLAQDILLTTRGDTLRGKISTFTNRQGTEQVEIKIDKKKQQIRLIDIKEYRKQGEVYQPIFAQGKYKIGKVISKGFLSEYLYTPTAYNKRAPFSQPLLIKENGGQLDVPKALMFRKSVAEFLNDCPSVSEKLLKKTYSRNQLKLIIQDYNACIALQKDNEIKKVTLKTKLEDFRTKLQTSKKIENKAAIRQMLLDFEEKSNAKQKIPDYLISALTDSVKDDLELTSILKDILEFN